MKQLLRATLKQQRLSLEPDFVSTASEQIIAHIVSQPYYLEAKHIGLYYAVQNEVLLTSLWHHALDHKKISYFPVIAQKKLLFLPATQSTLFRAGSFNIPEPDVASYLACAPYQLDLIIMPLLGFDLQGNRLGMGAGFYDQALAHHGNAFLLGVGYEFQKVPVIEAQPWDVSLHAVVTEQHEYVFSAT